MGEPLGGSRLAEHLIALREDLLEYFGKIAELKILAESGSLGIQPTEIPAKPEALAVYDMCKEFGIPRVAGGIEDQPYIWIEEVGLILSVSRLFGGDK